MEVDFNERKNAKTSRSTQGCTAMIFTKGEIEILGLCALCKDLPVETGGISEQEAIDVLLLYGFLRKSRSGLSYRVSDKGYDYLQSLGFDFQRDKAYLGKSKALYRRLETAKITTFFLKSGVDVFKKEIVKEGMNNVFVPSFIFRRKSFSNPLGATQLCGFYYLRNTMFVPYYISKDNYGIHTEMEESTFSSEVFLQGHKPTVLFTADGDISDVLKISQNQPVKKDKVNTDSFYEAIEKFRTPVAFITLDSNGLDVINIISVDNYREKLAKLILREDYATSELIDSDGINIKTNENLVIGFDSNTERMKRVIKNSKNTTHIVLFPFQLCAIQNYLKGKNARLHTIEVDAVEKLLKIDDRKFMLSNEPFKSEKGEYAYIPHDKY